MLIFFCSVAVLVVFFGSLSLRMWIKKESEFRGTCASQNPFLNPKDGPSTCGYCGKTVSEEMTCEKENQKKTS